jgi:NTP pyrophosphatase (non-canonical NTP hydrolase)
MKHLEELMQEHIEFTLATFPEATAISSTVKLNGEMYEVVSELGNPDKSNLAEEYVDCIMCLTDSAARSGLPPAELLEAFAKKLTKNKSRKWVKNPDNTYSHIKV